MRLAILFLILVFLIDILGFYISSYRIPAYDMILHFFGGFFVAMLFASFLLKNYPISTDKSRIMGRFSILVLTVLGLTVLVGVFWEFIEYIATVYFKNYLAQKYAIICCIGNLDDTITDLALDISGAIIFVLIYIKSFIKITKH